MVGDRDAQLRHSPVLVVARVTVVLHAGQALSLDLADIPIWGTVLDGRPHSLSDS